MSWCENNNYGNVTAHVSDTLPAIRFLLGDIYTPPEFSDAILTQSVTAMFILNQIPGFAIGPDQNTIQPNMTPDGLALICFKTSKGMLVGLPDKYEFRSRGFTEKIGSYRDAIMKLEEYIHDLENGSMFSGWQSFYGFLSGISGLSLLEVFTNMKVNAPFYSVTLTATGGTAAS